MRARRDALGAEERARRSALLCRQLGALECVRAASLIAGYRAFGSEADVHGALEAAHGAGAALCLPRVEADGVLSLRSYAPGEPLVPNRWGILEPQAQAAAVSLEAVRAVLVPALALDERGVRLGYGGGYYDRLLPRLSNAARVGVVFELQRLDALDAEPHDVHVQWVVTEASARRVAH